MFQHPASQSDLTLLKNCSVKRTRGSGPGGQHRNKVETAIRIIHNPTGIIVTSSDSKSKMQNKKRALAKLKDALTLQNQKTEKNMNINVE